MSPPRLVRPTLDRRWVFPPAPAPDAVAALARSLSLPPALCRVLAHRGYADPDDARAFLRPQASHIHSPSLLAGIYFIEYVFNWPGLGLLTITSVTALDYDVATASVIVSGALVALGSCAADIFASIADPRIRDG